MKNSNPDNYVGKPLTKVFNAITSGVFGNTEELTSLIHNLRNRADHYLVCADFSSYCQINETVSFFLK